MSKLPRIMLVLIALLLFVTLAPPTQASPAAQNSFWSAEYYNNVNLAGPPALLRPDADINFFWPEYTSPAPGYVNTSNYSVRWTRQLYFNTAGNWVFTTVSDDGMRVWVDDNITLDAWYDQGPTTHTGAIYLTAGWHLVKVEYYNRSLGGTARLTCAIQGAPTITNWRGEYYNNQSLSGSPALTRDDANINFNWGNGSPDPSIPVDHFSVRWTRTVTLSTGTWRFTTTTDDGVRLWVDNNLVLDRWVDQSLTAYAVDVSLSAGAHAIRMEYYENTGAAVAMLSYALVNPYPVPPTQPPSLPTPIPQPVPGVWRGQYFNNMTLSGYPVLVRNDPSLHFDWGAGSPDPSIPADYFSAKWDSTQVLPTTGYYTVLVSSDDGVRVWVDGSLVIDAWYDHAPTLFSANRWFGAGAHTVHVEFYEKTGGAMVGVDINPVSAPPPTGDVIVDDGNSGWQSGGKVTSWRNAGGYGGHSFWTFNNSYSAPYYNWARWYPNLPRPGNYELFAYIPGGVGSTTNARYWIYHNNRYDSAARAQAFYPNQWMSLGIYYFNDSGAEFVSLSDVTYECYLCRTVAFDAIKFSPR